MTTTLKTSEIRDRLNRMEVGTTAIVGDRTVTRADYARYIVRHADAPAWGRQAVLMDEAVDRCED
jgi:hypothetical protein